jgi:hybrid cluster-associated redox disulfide protein
MDLSSISPQTSVADLLDQYPQAIQYFLQQRMICPGCAMAEFDTLHDAANNYAIPVDDLISRLIDLISNSASTVDAPTET